MKRFAAARLVLIFGIVQPTRSLLLEPSSGSSASFPGCQHHRQPPTFHSRILFDLCQILQVRLYPLQNSGPELLVAHLPPPEPKGDLRLVSVRQESLQIAKLRLVIGFFRPGTELDLLDLYMRLLLPGRSPALVLLEEILPEIHQPANRRLGVGGYFDEVESDFVGDAQCLCAADDSDLLSTFRYEAYRLGGNFGVDPISFFGSDRLRLRKLNGRSGRKASGTRAPGFLPFHHMSASSEESSRTTLLHYLETNREILLSVPNRLKRSVEGSSSYVW